MNQWIAQSFQCFLMGEIKELLEKITGGGRSGTLAQESGSNGSGGGIYLPSTSLFLPIAFISAISFNSIQSAALPLEAIDRHNLLAAERKAAGKEMTNGGQNWPSPRTLAQEGLV